MDLNRRSVLKVSAAGAVVAATGDALTACTAGSGKKSPLPTGPTANAPVAPQGTTLEQTLLLGTPGTGGYTKIVPGPGEPFLRREDLVSGGGAAGGTASGVTGGGSAGSVGSTAAGATSSPSASAKPRTLAVFAQLTDIHIIDVQSPARVEFLDRFDDPDEKYSGLLPFQSSYRAHEMLSAQVADAMVQQINKIGKGPASGEPIAFTVVTGDSADNTQHNEVRWYIDVLDGQQVRPDSGDLTKFEGVADFVAYDPHYWHPDGAPAGAAPDLPHSKFGFPSVPGLLDACRKPFQAAGLKTPWYTAYGNHDGLMQGNFPPVAELAAYAVGNTKITGLPGSVDILTLALGLNSLAQDALKELLSGATRPVTPDPDRRPVTRLETIQEHFKTAGQPSGHGFTQNNVTNGHAYYTFDHGIVRCIVLDTVNPNGGADGSLDGDQFTWLEEQLKDGSSHYLDASGKPVTAPATGTGAGQDKLFVLFSHHTIDTMGNGTTPSGSPKRHLGPEVRDLLLRYPNVVLWVNGHTHVNSVKPYPRAASQGAGGFWELNTASHIDWPQQARLIEMIANTDGTLSIFGTIIDHAAPASAPDPLADSLSLASLSRELGGSDWQARDRPTKGLDGRRGTVQDRNVELLVPAPFAVPAA